jgi:hypothetical protein
MTGEWDKRVRKKELCFWYAMELNTECCGILVQGGATSFYWNQEEYLQKKNVSEDIQSVL